MRPAPRLRRLIALNPAAFVFLFLASTAARLAAQIYDGVTISGDLNVPSSGNVTFLNGAGFSGTNANIGAGGFLYWNQIGVLDNKLITIDTNGGIYLSGAGRQLTLGAGTVANGDISIYTDGSAGSTITNLGTLNHNSAFAGQVYASTFTNSGTVNVTTGTFYLGYPSATFSATNTATGTILATGSNTHVYVRGNVTNAGTITAQSSAVLHFDGQNTTANLGNITLSGGGRAVLEGTLNNSAATLAAPNGGSFEFSGGTISGGTISAGALTFTPSGGYLSNTLLSGNLTLGASAYVRFVDGTTFDGTTANIGSNAFLYWGQSGSLNDKTINIGSSGGIYLFGSENSLVLGANTTLTGTASIYSDGSAGGSVVTSGSITHNSTGAGYMYAPSFVNNGSITATAGTLYLNYPSVPYHFTNSLTGTVTADGASTTVQLRGDFDNNGTLTAQNGGTLYFDGNNTTANLGNIVLTTGGRARLNGTIDNSTATLNAPTGGPFELYGGTIAGGTITAGALTFTPVGGYLSGSSLAGDLAVPNSAYVRFTNGASFSGTNVNLGSSSYLYWEQVGSLSGRQINIGSFGGIYVYGSGNTLTLSSDTVVSGHTSLYSDGSTGTAITNLGTVTHNGTGSASMYAPSFTNSGSITATDGTLFLNYPSTTYSFTNAPGGTVTANNATVYLRGNFDNNGTVTAQNNGMLQYDGDTTTANLGNVILTTGGRARLSANLNNTSSMLVAPTGGSYEFYGGTIFGGTIAAGALTFTSSGGYLDNTTLSGDLNLANSSYVRFSSGTTFTGANANIGSSAFLYWNQGGTLATKTIAVGGSGGIYVNGAGNNLTVAADTTITGTGSIYSDGSAGTAITNLGTVNHTSAGAGYLYASSFTNAGAVTATAGTMYLNSNSTGYNFTNTGTITATGSGTDIYLRGNFDNNGTVIAQNSASVTFEGSNTTANLGNIVLGSGGIARLGGTLNNTGATLTAPSGGVFTLAGGEIAGGTIAAGALTFTNSGGYINNATISGDLNLNANAYVRFQNGASFTGANATIGSNSYLYWNQVGTLTGKAITVNGSSSGIYVYGANNALTIGPGTTITGNGSVYSDGSLGTSIVNQGTITHTAGSGNFWARSFTNSGQINASGGTIYLGSGAATYPFANAAGGTLTISGATAFMNGNFTNAGTLAVQSGTVYTNGNFTNLAGGVISGAGTIAEGITLAGGTLAPGNSIGTLSLNTGAFTVSSPSTLAIELGGTLADKLVFNNPGTINFSTNLLSLSLSLLAAPQESTTYDIMTIASGGTGITGRFVGLPNSGDIVTATFGTNTYSFAVNYLPNSIQLSFGAIPEPSTYALLAAGLGLVALAAWRRRR